MLRMSTVGDVPRPHFKKRNFGLLGALLKGKQLFPGLTILLSVAGNSASFDISVLTISPTVAFHGRRIKNKK